MDLLFSSCKKKKKKNGNNICVFHVVVVMIVLTMMQVDLAKGQAGILSCLTGCGETIISCAFSCGAGGTGRRADRMACYRTCGYTNIECVNHCVGRSLSSPSSANEEKAEKDGVHG